jgi:hypothetical protein
MLVVDLIEDGRIDGRGGVAINTLGEALQAAKADLAISAPEHLELFNHAVLGSGGQAAMNQRNAPRFLPTGALYFADPETPISN